jgi:carbon monoxide dehydrogenase subunit G
MEHEHTEHVAATPESVYAAICNPENLARFVPQVTAIRPTGDDHVEVDARYDGKAQHGEASFNMDAGRRRIEWAAESGYSGWMQVDADGGGSRLTLHLHTIHDAEHDHEVAATLDAIRMLVEAEV